MSVEYGVSEICSSLASSPLGLCGALLSLRLVRFGFVTRQLTWRFAKYQVVLCETRRFPVGNALLGEGGSLSSIVSSVLRFCVALLSVWFACFGFIYRYHRVSQSTNWYFAKRDGFRSETLCLEKEAACRRLFSLQLDFVWLYCRSGSLVSVLFIDIIAFRKVPIGTLRNETYTSVKMNLALLGR